MRAAQAGVQDELAGPHLPQGAPIASRPLTAPPVGPVPPSSPPPRGSTAPPAMPAHPLSTPPPQPAAAFGARDPSRPRRPPALIVEDPALSLPTPARRPWALMFVVLLIDIGLAVSGAWMLNQGLGIGLGGGSSGGSSGAASFDASPPRAR